jgi:prevent-host-death family protein
MTVRVGIRELQQHASQVIDQVVRGERVEVTRSGRLVAVIQAPAGEDLAYDDLIAAGIIKPGRGGLLDFEPLSTEDDQTSWSDVIVAMRDEDDR